ERLSADLGSLGAGRTRVQPFRSVAS
ncbi:anaerobic ribonucleoside-triphosphate reductase activating protein, partial [Rhodopseudomonas sp. WA056]|nr:anaerobic ribonucleoside-triphosphate reductase activating protein [Rhodopseudomonas sp. WA056]NEW89631.1 anaerobic ribonucleoside-triphosphate reductase activating protein [Rhodopseudomonas sp. WA056]